MAFSNEYLTEEEIELIKKTGHDALVNTRNGIFCYVNRCTVDRARKIWLIHYSRRADYGDSRTRDERFVLFYGAIDKNNIVELCLENLGIERDVQVKEKHNAKFIKYWAIKKINISQSLTVGEKDIRKLLEEIMSAYAILGTPNEKREDYYGKGKAIIKE